MVVGRRKSCYPHPPQPHHPSHSHVVPFTKCCCLLPSAGKKDSLTVSCLFFFFLMGWITVLNPCGVGSKETWHCDSFSMKRSHTCIFWQDSILSLCRQSSAVSCSPVLLPLPRPPSWSSLPKCYPDKNMCLWNS